MQHIFVRSYDTLPLTACIRNGPPGSFLVTVSQRGEGEQCFWWWHQCWLDLRIMLVAKFVACVGSNICDTNDIYETSNTFDIFGT